MALRLWSVRDAVVPAKAPVELVQSLVNGFLSEGVFGGCEGGFEVGGGTERLGEGEDLGAQEGGFEVEDGGGACGHGEGSWRRRDVLDGRGWRTRRVGDAKV